tara:strand:- start:2839 stop:3585 length:747 start_codon:yes stop_codon:yes gene_type:complete
MKVLADIGNSQIKISLSRNKEIHNIKTLPLDNINIIRQHFLNICKKQECSLFYSLVAGSNYEKKFLSITKKIFTKITRFKSSKSFLSVRSAYTIPTTLGSDRWAQIIGAHELYKKNAMIVSCGSAISVDYVTSKGVHEGGILLSGSERYTNCFSDINNLKGIRLPVSSKKTLKILENNTSRQIVTGYRIMISSAINNIYTELNKKSKNKILVILSGSYAKNISGLSIKEKIIEPYFVLKSLALIEDHF